MGGWEWSWCCEGGKKEADGVTGHRVKQNCESAACEVTSMLVARLRAGMMRRDERQKAVVAGYDKRRTETCDSHK